NTFSTQTVNPAVIAQAYEDIRWAPTQMNSQPLRLTLVQSPAAKYRLGPHMKRGNRDKTLAAPLTVIAAWIQIGITNCPNWLRIKKVPEKSSTQMSPPGKIWPKCPVIFKLVISSLPYELMAYTLAR